MIWFRSTPMNLEVDRESVRAHVQAGSSIMDAIRESRFDLPVAVQSMREPSVS